MFPWKRILVATDFSECSRRALRDAMALAAAHQGEVTIVHATPLPAGFAISDPNVVVQDPGGPAIKMADYLEAKAQALLDKEASSFATPGVTIHTRTVFGDPVREITALASAIHADLLVVGTHGRSGWRHMVLGSVAERLIQASKIPVLTSKSEIPCVEDPKGSDTPELRVDAEQMG